MKLTVFYDGQFWVGVLEEVIDEKLKAVRYVFGSEPYDWDVMNFVNQRMLSWISRAGEAGRGFYFCSRSYQERP
ncbi:MAG: hypothetical protein H6Q74_3015 [Firmicutes bacterium]|nr:hypothetical protein [Bacillota bacterium]